MIPYKITASYHMLDAYDLGVKWTCPCEACDKVRASPYFEEELWKALYSRPRNPERLAGQVKSGS